MLGDSVALALADVAAVGITVVLDRGHKEAGDGLGVLLQEHGPFVGSDPDLSPQSG